MNTHIKRRLGIINRLYLIGNDNGSGNDDLAYLIIQHVRMKRENLVLIGIKYFAMDLAVKLQKLVIPDILFKVNIHLAF